MSPSTHARPYSQPDLSLPDLSLNDEGVLLSIPSPWLDSREIGRRMVHRLWLNEPSQTRSFYEMLLEEGPDFFSGMYGRAEMRRQWKKSLKESKVAHDRPYTFRKNTRLLYFFPSVALLRIVQHGILNQHQAGIRLTTGAKRPAWRAQLENERIGIQLEARYNPRRDNPIHYLRPKSVILDVTELPLYQNKVSNNGLQYGEFVAVLKDSVKDRSTWSPGDSYTPQRPTTTWNAPGSFGFDYSLGSELHPREYFEAQIWGELDLRDIESFWAPEEIKPSSRQLLERIGLPVYTYSTSSQPWKSTLTPSPLPIIPGKASVTSTLSRKPLGWWKDFLPKSKHLSSLVCAAKLRGNSPNQPEAD